MAELRDIHGNPVQLTDEHGNPVKLTDEYGNPVHVSGVATAVPPGGAATTTVFGTDKATHDGRMVADMLATEPRTTDVPLAVNQPTHNDREPGELRRSSSSSSSSSGDDGQGGRRKKNKGLKDKIKEKLTGRKHKNKEEHPPAQQQVPPLPLLPVATTQPPQLLITLTMRRRVSWRRSWKSWLVTTSTELLRCCVNMITNSCLFLLFACLF